MSDQATGSMRITRAPTPTFTVKLTYFRDNGKYYSGGEYTTYLIPLWAILQEVKDKARANDLPGINGNQWITFVQVPGHPHEHPALIMPERRLTNFD